MVAERAVKANRRALNQRVLIVLRGTRTASDSRSTQVYSSR